jgi:hypothetical protein
MCTITFDYLISNQLKEIKERENYDNDSSCSLSYDSQDVSSTSLYDDYKSFNLPSEWWNENNLNINKLIYDILKLKSEERPTANNLLQNEFYNEYNNSNNKCIIGNVMLCPNSVVKLTEKQIDMAKTKIKKITDNTLIINNTLQLYALSYNIKDLSITDKILTCIWIVSKIIYGKPLKIDEIELHKLMDAERKICKFINFRYAFNCYSTNS